MDMMPLETSFNGAALEPTNPTAQRMWWWLPRMWYARSRTALGHLEAQGALLEQFAADLAEIYAGRYPQTAPDWALDRWEIEVGLSNGAGLSVAERRARILARFRAFGSTVYRLKQIATAWNYGDIAIIPDPEDFRLYMKFASATGQPADLQSVIHEIRDSVQAHVDIEWLTIYLTWGEVLRSGVTWQQLQAQGITWDQLRRMSYEDLLVVAQT